MQIQLQKFANGKFCCVKKIYVVQGQDAIIEEKKMKKKKNSFVFIIINQPKIP